MRIGEVPAVRENCLLPGRRQLDNPASLEVKMNRRCFLASGVAAGAIAWHEVGAESIQKTQARNSELAERLVNLDAQPDKLQLDLSQTAVIVVDMQNDFCSKGGLLEFQGVDLTILQPVVPKIRKVLDVARKTGLKVIYLKMGYKPDLSDVGLRGSASWNNNRDVGKPVKTSTGIEGRILIRDTWNTEIIGELKPEPGDIVLYKTRFSGFYQTDLDSTLKKLGVRFLIVTGCTTSVCVESTIRDAVFRDYSPVLLSDCTAEPIGFNLPHSNYEASLFLIKELLGWVSTSDQFIQSIEPARA